MAEFIPNNMRRWSEVDRIAFPKPIGTIEMICLQNNGSYARHEVPIIDTFEVQGELFGLVLDIDEAVHGGDSFLRELEDGDSYGDVCYVHIGTGSRGIDYMPSAYAERELTRRCDQYNLKRAIARHRDEWPPVRGSVMPIPPLKEASRG